MYKKNDFSKNGFEEWADFSIICLLLSVTLLFYFGSLSGIQSFRYQGLMAISIISGIIVLLLRNESIPQTAKMLPFFSYSLSVIYQLMVNWSFLGKRELAMGGIKVAGAVVIVVMAWFVIVKNYDASLWRKITALMICNTGMISMGYTFMMVAHLSNSSMIDGLGAWNESFCEMAFICFSMQMLRPKEYKMDRIVFWRYLRAVVYGIVVISAFMTVISIGIQDIPNYRLVIAIWIPYILMFLFLFIFISSFISKNSHLYYLEEEKEYMQSVSELLELIEIQTKLYEDRISNTDEVTKKLLEEAIQSLKKEEKNLRDELYSQEEITEMIEDKRKYLDQNQEKATVHFEDLGNEETFRKLIEKENVRQKYIVTIGELLCKDNKSNQAILQLGEYVSGRSDEIEPESRMVLYYAGLIKHDGSIPIPVKEVMREIVRRGE